MAAIGLPLPSDPVRPASLSKDSSSRSAAPSSNYRTHVSMVKLGKAAMSNVQRAFGLNMRGNSVNGAHNGHFPTNNIALIGNCAEDRILAQNGLASLEKHSGTTAREDSDVIAAEGFATIDEAVKAFKEGKFVLVVDDENRENEVDLIMAGSLVAPEAMAFIVKHSTGIVSVAMKGEDLDRLQLPLMLPQQQNTESSKTAFTWTVDAKIGTTTGVSAEDRCKTIRALASPSSRPDDFAAPGHIFP